MTANNTFRMNNRPRVDKMSQLLKLLMFDQVHSDFVHERTSTLAKVYSAHQANIVTLQVPVVWIGT